MILDEDGNLYGSAGVVFELAHSSNGWTETALCALPQSQCSDTGYAYGSPVFDTLGNLYGTTERGGTHDWGTVYELTPNSGGGWTQSVLYNFTGRKDGRILTSNLIFDPTGRLYGTTQSGGDTSRYQGCFGAHGCGVIFQLTPTPLGGWEFRVLHEFAQKEGAVLEAGLLRLKGAYYGTASSAGPTGAHAGDVFKLVHTPSGWTESTVFGFRELLTGKSPVDSVISDSAGDLYGTTVFGGSSNQGVVFKLTPGPKHWTEHILHNFTGGSDGEFPFSSLVFDRAGNLYGTTSGGGTACSGYGCGVVFKITP